MGLHSYMRIQVVQSTICLFTTIPSTFVHSLNLFESSTRALVLLSTWDWNEGIDLGRMVLGWELVVFPTIDAENVARNARKFFVVLRCKTRCRMLVAT